MKIAKFQWSLVIFAAFFSFFAHAFNANFVPTQPSYFQEGESGFNSQAPQFNSSREFKSRNDEMSVEKFEALFQLKIKINKIIALISSRSMNLGLNAINSEDVASADPEHKDFRKFMKLLDWLHRYLKAENKLVENHQDSSPERYASWFLMTNTLASCVTFDVGSALFYGLPAAYAANKVMAPELKNELSHLKQTKLKMPSQTFSTMFENQSIQTVLHLAMALNNGPSQKCILSSEQTHCLANELADGAFYQPFLLWKKGNEPWKAGHRPWEVFSKWYKGTPKDKQF